MRSGGFDHLTTRRWPAYLVGVGALLVTLALAACGSTGSAGSAGSAGSGGAPATATASSSGQIPGGGMAVRPCPGLTGDATQAGTLAVTLTPSASSATLHPGELAQVRLPATMHWTLTTSALDHLTSVATAGGQDSALNVCYWTFRADTVGSVTLRFSGAHPCEGPPSGCSNAILEQTFTLTIA